MPVHGLIELCAGRNLIVIATGRVESARTHSLTTPLWHCGPEQLAAVGFRCRITEY